MLVSSRPLCLGLLWLSSPLATPPYCPAYLCVWTGFFTNCLLYACSSPLPNLLFYVRLVAHPPPPGNPSHLESGGAVLSGYSVSLSKRQADELPADELPAPR
jgi:hypothetical protein